MQQRGRLTRTLFDKQNSLERYDTANRFTLVHEVKRVVDIIQRHGVRNQVINIDFALHVPIDYLRNIGSSFSSPKRRTSPHSTGDQLEWACTDFFTSPSDTNDD